MRPACVGRHRGARAQWRDAALPATGAAQQQRELAASAADEGMLGRGAGGETRLQDDQETILVRQQRQVGGSDAHVVWWRVAVCGGVWWCGDVLWRVVACGGVLWRVVACCGVLWRVVACGGM